MWNYQTINIYILLYSIISVISDVLCLNEMALMEKLESEQFLPFKTQLLSNDEKSIEYKRFFNEIRNKISSAFDDEGGSGEIEYTEATKTSTLSRTTSQPPTSISLTSVSHSSTATAFTTAVTTTAPVLGGYFCNPNNDNEKCEEKYNERCIKRLGIYYCGCLRGFSRRADLSSRMCYAVDVIEVTIKYTDRSFDKAYEDTTSWQYNNLVKEVTQMTLDSFSQSNMKNDFLSVTVKSVKPGSIVIDTELKFLQNNNTNLIQENTTEFKNQIESIFTNYSNTMEHTLTVTVHELKNPCEDVRLNYCDKNSICIYDNGTFSCACKTGFLDISSNRPGEVCRDACTNGYCLNNGQCSLYENNNICKCSFWYAGNRCEMNLRIIIGFSAAGVVILLVIFGIFLFCYKKSKKRYTNILYFKDHEDKLNYGFTIEDEQRWMSIAEAFNPQHPASQQEAENDRDSLGTTASGSTHSSPRLYLGNTNQLFKKELLRRPTVLPESVPAISGTVLRNSFGSHTLKSSSIDSFF